MTDFDSAERLFLKLQLALDGGGGRLLSTLDVQDSEFRKIANALNLVFKDLQRDESLGKVIAGIFEAVAEPHLIQPTIIYDFPLAVSPLSKKKPDEPDWVERFEFYIGGFEVGNAFSELNDPVDQLARFEQQMTEKERGDSEAHQMDEDYVRALGYGLPPTAGEGIGIDRLTMLLTDSKSIRDVILFPLLRPQTKQAETAEGKHGESAE
jgi:lysyl-tRNA synthetase class 2